MKIVTAAEMREIDRRTAEAHGVPSLQLMENAATRLVEFLVEKGFANRTRPLVVLCGKGNNGGDGLAFARLWQRSRGETPQVFLFAEPKALQGDAAENFLHLRNARISVTSVTQENELAAVRTAVGKAGVVVDALLGTGLRGPAEGLLAGLIEEINRLREAAGENMTVVSVDMPSGLPSDGAATTGPVVRADFTVAFSAPKMSHVLDGSRQWVGDLRVASIGSPDEVIEQVSQSKWRWLQPWEFRDLPLRRRRDAHKGDFGHVLIAAGSKGKAGAAALAGLGSLRAGAGLTTIATPEGSLPVVASFAPEYMLEPLAETDTGSISLRSLEYSRFDGLLEGKSVLALGPGLSTHPETQEFVRTVVARCPIPLILDADGLNAFAGRADELKNRAAQFLAVTPHPGEMARLAHGNSKEIQQRRIELAQECARRWNAFVILKGYQTLIAAPGGELFINSTGTPAMAAGGTGDVLTGVLAGLTAQFGSADWGRVLALGVWLHGRAGEIVASRGGASLLASELAAAVQQARAELQASPA